MCFMFNIIMLTAVGMRKFQTWSFKLQLRLTPSSLNPPNGTLGSLMFIHVAEQSNKPREQTALGIFITPTGSLWRLELEIILTPSCLFKSFYLFDVPSLSGGCRRWRGYVTPQGVPWTSGHHSRPRLGVLSCMHLFVSVWCSHNFWNKKRFFCKYFWLLL